VAESYVAERAGVTAGEARTAPAWGLILLLFMALLAGLAVAVSGPPAAAPEAAPAAEFSSGRAMKHLRVVAGSPRPVGSAAHAAARDYLVRELGALGLATEVQSATVVGPQGAGSARAGSVQNVLARMPGTNSTRAVLLAGHYDSVPNSPGASDDGSAVTAMLEVARALKAGPAPRNDVIFLFTDGEEVGLLGAHAFVDEHPWAADVGVVFNLEARGDGGPALMFETSDGNGRLIREFAAAARHPMANSLSYEVYKRLPNDTDMTVFKKAGMAGLNFAYIDGIARYHTRADSVENIDERSLQQQGANALALARHFGGLDLNEVRGPNSVYFNPLGSFFVHYPSWLVLPLAALALLLFACVVAVGLRGRLLTARGLLFGFAAFPVAAVAAWGAVKLGVWLVRALHRGEEFAPWGETYRGGLYLVGLVLLAAAAFAALYNLFRKKTGVNNLAVGALAWWTLLAAAVGLLVPGASYLLAWPLLFALAGTLAVFAGRGLKPAARILVLALCAAPALLLFSVTIDQLFSALSFNGSTAVAALSALLLGLLVLQFDAVAARRRWLVPAGAAVLALALIAGGALTAGFDAEHPRVGNLFYSLNADTGKAYWASLDDGADEWTEQFFREAKTAPLEEHFPATGFEYLQADAPAAQLPAPEVAVLGDETRGDVRTLRLRLSSPRGAQVLTAFAAAGTEVLGARVNGKAVGAGAPAGSKRPWGLNYYAAPGEGVELELDVRASGPAGLRVNDRSYGLPELPGVTLRPRPAHHIPSPSPFSDVALVSKSFSF